MNRECNIWACVGRQEHEHTHDGSILPGFSKGRSISITANGSWSCRSWYSIAIRHVACLQDFCNQSSLLQRESSLIHFGYLNAQEPSLWSWKVWRCSVSLTPSNRISSSSTAPSAPAKIVSSTYTTRRIPCFLNKHGSLSDCSYPRSSNPSRSFSKNVRGAWRRPYKL